MRNPIDIQIKKEANVRNCCYKTLVVSLIFPLLGLLQPGTILAQTWYSTNWGYRKAITIDYTKVGTGPHTNFPVLVSLTNSDLQSKALASGNDILFTLSDGTTKLNHEIESYTSGTGTLVAWVEIPSLSSAANTIIYMYYGYTSATSQQNVNGTWNTNYKGVWHFNNNSFSDATSTGNTSVNSGTTNSATAKIAGGRNFATNGSYIRVPTSNWSVSNGTISLWINSNAFSGTRHQYIFGHTTQPAYSNRIQLYTNDTGGNVSLGLGGSHTAATNIQALSAGQWYYITLAWSGSSYSVYVNGSVQTSSTYSNLTTLHSFAHIGKQGNEVNPGSPDESFDGFIDEARVSNVARSAGWILTEYNNQNSPSTFYSVGNQQALRIFTGTGNFSTAARWTGSSLPSAGDYLIIDGACTVDNNAGTNNVAFGSLVIGTATTRTLSWAASGTNRLNVSNVSAGSVASALDMTNGGTLIVRGTLTATNLTFTPGTGTIEIQSTMTLPAAYATYNSLTVNGSGITVGLGVTTAITGNLTITTGTLNANGFNISESGNWSNSDTFTAGTQTVTFSGSNAQTITQTGTGNFYNLIINKSANEVTLNNSITVLNTLTLTARCVMLGPNDLTIGDSGDISGGTSASFIVTNSTGKLIQNNVGKFGKTGIVEFPVGTTTSSYSPVSINNSSGTADAFDVMVSDNVYENGTTGNVLMADVVKKTWFVSEAVAGGSNVNLTVQWTDTDEGTSFRRNQCGLSHYHNAAWDAPTMAVATGPNPYTIHRNSITSFSPFAVADAQPLPVTLLYFTGKEEDKKTMLTWATASEKNNKGFTIEKSLDGSSFKRIGFVDGQGNSTKKVIYNFVDSESAAKAAYYRLKQVDFDDQFENSDIIYVQASTENGLALYPNPVTDRVRIEGDEMLMPSSSIMLSVLSDKGNIIISYTGTVQKATEILNEKVTALERGVYFIKMKYNGQESLQKFLKN